MMNDKLPARPLIGNGPLNQGIYPNHHSSRCGSIERVFATGNWSSPSIITHPLPHLTAPSFMISPGWSPLMMWRSVTCYGGASTITPTPPPHHPTTAMIYQKRFLSLSSFRCIGYAWSVPFPIVMSKTIYRNLRAATRTKKNGNMSTWISESELGHIF